MEAIFKNRNIKAFSFIPPKNEKYLAAYFEQFQKNTTITHYYRPGPDPRCTELDIMEHFLKPNVTEKTYEQIVSHLNRNRDIQKDIQKTQVQSSKDQEVKLNKESEGPVSPQVQQDSHVSITPVTQTTPIIPAATVHAPKVDLSVKPATTIVNIKGLDKTKLFMRVYNFIQTTSFGDPKNILKTLEEAEALLKSACHDYFRFNVFCDLNKDEIDTNTFNMIYRNDSIFWSRY